MISFDTICQAVSSHKRWQRESSNRPPKYPVHH